MIREWIALVAICGAVAAAADKTMDRARAKHEVGLQAVAVRYASLEAAAGTQKRPLPPAPSYRSPGDMTAGAHRAVLEFTAGAFILMCGRLLSRRRQRSQEAFTSFAVPCLTALAGLGLLLQLGYEFPAVSTATALPSWRGAEFGRGFLLSSVSGFLIMGLPWDPGLLLRMVRPFLLPAIALAFGVLRLFGDSEHGAFISLLGFQPVELVKLAFAAFLAAYCAPRASKLLMHRTRILGVIAPRPGLLVGALLALVVLYVGVLAVNDLGVALVLSVLFVLMFWVVTQATGWIAAGLLTLALLTGGLLAAPETWLPAHVRLRVEMWFDPWSNGFQNGDQLGRSLWSIAAGGLFGQGLGSAPRGALPAGYTDLMFAHLVEETGFLGAALYLGLLGLLIVQGLVIASRSRTADRALLAASLALLVFSQWLVIFGGTTGMLPLTGIVVPFLSHGKTSMVVFVAVGALLVRLAGAGKALAVTEELSELSRGVRTVGTGVLLTFVFALAAVFYQAVFRGVSTSAQGIVTRLGPEPERPCGRLTMSYNPRVTSLVERLPRGPILDRNGEILAATDENGKRVYPLGSALGTLLGPPNDRVLRGSWMVEGEFDSRLRGYEDRSEELGVYVGSPETPAERVLTPASANPSKYLGLARASLRKRGDRVCDVRADRPALADSADEEWRSGTVLEDDEEAAFKRLPRHDLKAFAELLADSAERREGRLRAWALDTASRTVTVTIDARLQRRLADALRTAAARSQVGASSGVVIDVDSGDVLARGQFPDFDPQATDVAKAFAEPGFSRMYGPWPDRTGLHGIFQTGSVGKLATALAAARSNRLTDPREPVFECKGAFEEKGWGEPIRDHEDDRAHGRLGFEEALGRSCNIYFGQLGLSLGPEPLVDLFKAGLDVAWYERDATSGLRRFDPGSPRTRLLASSSFGQGALAMSVLQAGRMAAAIGREGRYLVCSPHVRKGAPCEERELLPRTAAAREGNRRILAGMRQAMEKGTGRTLEPSTPKGVRVYGKTGTAEAPALRDETPYGFRRGQEKGLKSHSWFVAIAEPESNPEASTRAPGRLAVAVVVPRAGLGSTAAGPAAMTIISAAEALGYLRPR